MGRLKFIRLYIIAVLLEASFSSLHGQTNDNYIKGIRYYSENKFLLAIGSFKKAIGDGLNDPKVYFFLGNSYANNGDNDKAIEQFKLSLELADDPVLQSLITHNIGYVYYLMKDYKSSIDYLSRAYQMNSNLVQSFWYEGMAYYRLKDKANTIKEWEEYLDKDPQGPQSDNIRKALDILKTGKFNIEKDILFSSESTNPETNSQPSVEPLINIEGVLDQVKPVDKGKTSDTQLEDIE